MSERVIVGRPVVVRRFVAMVIAAQFAVAFHSALASGPGLPVSAFDTQRRALWTRSRIVGSPQPPPPMTVRRAFANLEFEHPLFIRTQPGGNDLLVVQQDGRILRFANDPLVRQTELWLDVGREAYSLAFHPDYANNGHVYVFSNGPPDAGVKSNRISRFLVDRSPPYRCDPGSQTIVLEWESNGHNGGDLAFGPDGMLYITAGDGTSDSDANVTGQDLGNLNSTIIRIDVDRPEIGRHYSVPPDNPFQHVPGARPEIWAYGYRNPWRMAFDQRTGRLWIGDNGQDQWEMVHLVRRGDNAGWSVFEAGHPFRLKRSLGPTLPIEPAIEHPHSEARSLTGGIVYYGRRFEDLQGAYLYGDYSTGRIWAARYDGAGVTGQQEIADTTLQILGFGVDPDGEVLIVDYAGGIYELAANPAPDTSAAFPRLLSQTGLFISTADHRPDPALIPYSVNAPLWSDGAVKQRFIAVPGDGKVRFGDSNGWEFPDGTVLVKTFCLPVDEDGRDAHRRIETRLLTRQQGEWQGYTYLWNDAQTDAELAGPAAVQRTFTVADSSAPQGRREQLWHFPSRAECGMCHTRAANFVLGPSVLQMNRPHDYGHGVVRNQLEVLEQLGVFSDRLSRRPDRMPQLADPADPAQPLEVRARSYLHANCSSCHVKAGGGNSLIDLDFRTSAEKSAAIDQRPQHDSYGMSDARIIAPRQPDRSVLLLRMMRRGEGQMPPLASHAVDQQAVQLINQWIAGMSR